MIRCTRWLHSGRFSTGCTKWIGDSPVACGAAFHIFKKYMYILYLQNGEKEFSWWNTPKQTVFTHFGRCTIQNLVNYLIFKTSLFVNDLFTDFTWVNDARITVWRWEFDSSDIYSLIEIIRYLIWIAILTEVFWITIVRKWNKIFGFWKIFKNI